MQKITVVVVDDHPMVRQGIRSLLARYADIEVIGEAESCPQALTMVGKLQPDIILLDIRLGGSTGLDLARRVQRLGLQSRVIVVTAHDDENYVLQAAQAGAHGYLLKGASGEILADTVRAVHNGESRLSPALANAAFGQLRSFIRAQSGSDSELGEQDLRLLKMIAESASVAEIAKALCMSDRTVKRKTQELLEALGATSRAQAIAEAFRRGLL